MASVCDLCGKKPSFGMSLSHSHRRNKRRWDPNIPRTVPGGPPRRVRAAGLVRPATGATRRPPTWYPRNRGLHL